MTQYSVKSLERICSTFFASYFLFLCSVLRISHRISQGTLAIQKIAFMVADISSNVPLIFRARKKMVVDKSLACKTKKRSREIRF